MNMSFIKYSIGGQITSVTDDNSVEEKEVVATTKAGFDKLAVCNNCGLQHAIDEHGCTCACGNTIRLN